MVFTKTTMNIFILFFNKLLIIQFLLSIIVCDELPTCQPKDFEYSFTECDEFQGRWRVSVPKEPGKCTGGNPNAPVRANNCFTSCSSGSFYDPSSLICKPCSPGSFSTGGGIKVTHFNSTTLEKNGIRIRTQSFPQSLLQGMYCDQWKVKPSGVIEVEPSPVSRGTCQSAMSMNVRIVKKGSVRFTYQYEMPSDSALLFTFHHKNNEQFLYDSDPSTMDDIGIKFPETTDTSNQWSSLNVVLQPGFYSLVWSSLIFESGNSRDEFGSHGADRQKIQRSIQPFILDPESQSLTSPAQGFIRIKSIEIYGTAFASDCTPCDEGFFSNSTGSEKCLPCPVNTFSSEKSSVTCSPCNSITSYSPPGSTACIKRPICDFNDAYQVKSYCVDGKQATSYKWIEPKICHDANKLISSLGSGAIPCNSSTLEADRECSPGMELITGKCSFCPPYHYNDGSLSKCKQCPPSSLPLYNLILNTWKHEFDPSVSQLLSSDCFSTLDPSNTFNDCDGNLDPWKVIPSTQGSYIRSSEAPLDSVLKLSLTVPGFRHSSGGQLIFAFSLIGSDSSLQLYESKSDMSRKIGSWTANKSLVEGGREDHEMIEVRGGEKNEFRHVVRENVPVSFVWIYRRTQLVQSHAKIYFISLSNPLTSGAVSCSSCNMDEINHSDGSEEKSKRSQGLESKEITQEDAEYECIPCPSGQYLRVEGEEKRNLVTFSSRSFSSTVRQESVANGTNNSLSPKGKPRRKNRENGLKSGGKLGGLNAECLKCPLGYVINSTLSFPKGMKESCIKCGPGLTSNTDSTECIADCESITIDEDQYSLAALKYPQTFQANQLFSASGMKYFHAFNISLCGSPIKDLCSNNASSPKFSTSINPMGFIDSSFSSLVCRSTIIPGGAEYVFSTQSVSLAGRLRGISRETNFLNQQVIDQFSNVKSDLHFYFEPTSPTTSCKKGRSVIITLRCDPSIPREASIISAPSSCPLATCDGCTFNFLIRSNSSATCRKCQESDYDTVIGECINGVQNVHLINPKNCIIDTESLKNTLSRPCSVLPESVQLFLMSISFFAVIMSILLIYCWKKNQKLEYNYSKLIENKNTSESCMEEDEDEENQETTEHQSVRQKIISSRNEVDYAGYETIQLTKHMQEDVC